MPKSTHKFRNVFAFLLVLAAVVFVPSATWAQQDPGDDTGSPTSTEPASEEPPPTETTPPATAAEEKVDEIDSEIVSGLRLAGDFFAPLGWRMHALLEALEATFVHSATSLD